MEAKLDNFQKWAKQTGFQQAESKSLLFPRLCSLHTRILLKNGPNTGVCEFTGLECENGVLEWNTGVEYWSIQTEFLDANIANQDTHQV